ncbi:MULTISPECIES: hypothetical protein [unclassified Prochlorococcus]|uniref:hypothetical protein n=1 Tax=unclassified Prochlorococcus TaxID=2627481 RepID=UPI00069216A1|nr:MULTISPECIES: hypothetical protein [unclassified Prochlorococcus]
MAIAFCTSHGCISLTLIVIDSLKLPSLILVAIATAFILAVAGSGLVLVDDGFLMRCQVSNEATLLMNFCWGPVTALGSIAAVFMHGASDAVLSILLLTVVVLFSAGLSLRNLQR